MKKAEQAWRAIVAAVMAMIVLASGQNCLGQTFAGESVHGARNIFDSAKFVQADRTIEQAIAQKNCPGAVLLIGRGDRILYQKAYGNRAVEPAVAPMALDTVFDLASLTKPVATATSIMILADRGKIQFDEPVARYIPEFAQNGKEKVTISDLLLHVSGLMPDNDVSDYANGPKAAWDKIFALKLNWAPESHFAYSDLNFIVLGEVVHRVDGRTLDVFAHDEIFVPLGMRDTTFNPPPSLKARSAPTERRDGQWIIGQVHDPRSYALGGVAGHAGVFSTAADLSRFCRMILRGGELDGRRILSSAMVRQWTTPRPVPAPALDQHANRVEGPAHRTYGFDIDTLYAGIRGERFDRATTFGHTGFTGTAFWIDPPDDCYFILLTNSIHPNGKGNVLRLRSQVATIVAEALLGPSPADLPATRPAAHPSTAAADTSGVLCGIDVLEQNGFAPLVGHQVALITNQSGRDHRGRRTVDLLAHAPGVQLVRLFSPEHGIDGVLDEKVNNSVDQATGLPIFSLYGPSRIPTPEMLEGIDTLVYDIQDVGARFYTYITTLGLCMRATGENHVRFIVLDRPNPNTGLVVCGPLADKAHFGFTAFGALPLVHGMTVGELARFYQGEFDVRCDLEVVTMENWRRSMWFDGTGITWVNPSPNLRNPNSTLLYPSICLLEATNVSVGRGTDQPFEILGAPWMDGQKLAVALNGASLPGVRFVPLGFMPAASRFAHQKCSGVFAIVTDRNRFEPGLTGATIVWQLHHLFAGDFDFQSVGRLLQNDEALAALKNAAMPAQAVVQWNQQIERYKAARAKYLLYQ